ncbi:MAG: hypothetical protein AAF787_12050, partial [Chloroflexota bacterium]
MTEQDLFVGKWVLDPTQSAYELGEPPQSGSYTITRDGDVFMFVIEWVGADGKEMAMSFTGIVDGVERPYENPDIADSTCFTRVDEHNLNSTATKNGVIINDATRQLSPDGQTMTVVQRLMTPDGQKANTAIYR